MPSDQRANSHSVADPQSAPGGGANARVRAELAREFARQSTLLPVIRPLQDLSAVMELAKLATVAATVNVGNEIIFTLISREYIQTGLNWINAMQRIGLNNFFVISGDEFTSETLDQRGIHSVQAEIDEGAFDTSFVTHDGFTSKGLAMIAFKFPVTGFLLARGYSVVFSDADAVWMKDPMSYMRGADISFQRVIYHPPSIASLWGFTACTGFFFVRHNTKTIAFLDRCVREHLSFHCDQVAMNVALLESDPAWRCEQMAWTPPDRDVWNDPGRRRAAFTSRSQFPITGELRQDGLRVWALPNDKFWRQKWVGGPLPDMVICHPNSPKDDLEKMKALDAMGLRFAPRA